MCFSLMYYKEKALSNMTLFFLETSASIGVLFVSEYDKYDVKTKLSLANDSNSTRCKQHK